MPPPTSSSASAPQLPALSAMLSCSPATAATPPIPSPAPAWCPRIWLSPRPAWILAGSCSMTPPLSVSRSPTSAVRSSPARSLARDCLRSTKTPPLICNTRKLAPVSLPFAPVDGGSFTNAVVFSSNGGNSTNVVTGYGVTPAQLYVVPYSVDFGAVVVGSHTQAMFVVHNGGEAPLTDGVATLSPGPFAFPLSTLDPQLSTTFSVPGLSSTNVLVSFTPASAGSFTNQVVFDAGNAGHSPHTVTGTGLTQIGRA